MSSSNSSCRERRMASGAVGVDGGDTPTSGMPVLQDLGQAPGANAQIHASSGSALHTQGASRLVAQGEEGAVPTGVEPHPTLHPGLQPGAEAHIDAVEGYVIHGRLLLSILRYTPLLRRGPFSREGEYRFIVAHLRDQISKIPKYVTFFSSSSPFFSRSHFFSLNLIHHDVHSRRGLALFCRTIRGHFIFVAENNGLYRPINPLEDKSCSRRPSINSGRASTVVFTLIGVVHQNNAACSAVGTVQNIVQNILRRRGNMERILCRGFQS